MDAIIVTFGARYGWEFPPPTRAEILFDRFALPVCVAVSAAAPLTALGFAVRSLFYG